MNLSPLLSTSPSLSSPLEGEGLSRDDLKAAVESLAREKTFAGKRAVDLALGVIVGIAAAPVVGLLIILVRATSPGPAIYRQSRLGLNRRPFTLYKIRTMKVDCEKETGPRWASPDDERATKMGKFLRAAHLDELPQLWNVMRGDMSLIGPRPERPEIASKIRKSLRGFDDRLTVRPGITGLAQVQAPPDSTIDTVKTKLSWDLLYIEKMNFWLDMRILAATLLKVLNIPFGRIGRWLRLPQPPPDAEATAERRFAPHAAIRSASASASAESISCLQESPTA